FNVALKQRLTTLREPKCANAQILDQPPRDEQRIMLTVDSQRWGVAKSRIERSDTGPTCAVVGLVRQIGRRVSGQPSPFEPVSPVESEMFAPLLLVGGRMARLSLWLPLVGSGSLRQC